MNAHETLMYDIDILWNESEAELYGHKDGDDYACAYDECIYREQAVDKDGKARYKSYSFSIVIGEELRPKEVIIPFTAEDMEAYARTWKNQA